MDKTECLAEFRVQKQDIPVLANVLQLPMNIRCPQRTIWDRIEGLCMLLRRFSYPCRYSDMISRFGRPVPELCMITNEVMDNIFNNHGHRISQWNDDVLSLHLLQEYADVIHAKGAPLENCFGFIDGTVRPIARPDQHQRIVYAFLSPPQNKTHKCCSCLSSVYWAIKINKKVGTIWLWTIGP